MAEQRGAIPTRPRPRAARVIGVLNLVFGAGLVAYGALMLGGMASNAMMAAPIHELERALEAKAERDHREVIDRLAALEALAGSGAAKEIYRQERERREQRGPRIGFEAKLMMMGGRMQTFGAWTIVNSSTSIALNLLLIASGAALVQRVEWGRRLGLWVAGLKLARLAILQVVFVAVVVPPFSRELGEAVGEAVAAQGGGGMPAGMPNMTQIYAIMYTALGVATLVLGSIYPIVMLAMLRKPGVTAACAPADVRAAEILREAGAR